MNKPATSLAAILRFQKMQVPAVADDGRQTEQVDSGHNLVTVAATPV